MAARRIIVDGHVQGVFFRDWTSARARELGVTGWVRNRRDGSVEIHAEADAAVLARFVEWLHRGSPAARVDAVRVEDAAPEPSEGFTRRPTA